MAARVAGIRWRCFLPLFAVLCACQPIATTASWNSISSTGGRLAVTVAAAAATSSWVVAAAAAASDSGAGFDIERIGSGTSSSGGASERVNINNAEARSTVGSTANAVERLAAELAASRAELASARNALRSAEHALHECSSSSGKSCSGYARGEAWSAVSAVNGVGVREMDHTVDAYVLASAVRSLRQTAVELEQQLLGLSGDFVGDSGVQNLDNVRVEDEQRARHYSSDAASRRFWDEGGVDKHGKRHPTDHRRGPGERRFPGDVEAIETEPDTEPMSIIGLCFMFIAGVVFDYWRISFNEKQLEGAFTQPEPEAAMKNAQRIEFAMSALRAALLAYLGSAHGQAPLFSFSGDHEALQQSEGMWWLSLTVAVDAGMRAVALYTSFPRSIASARLQWRSMVRDISFLLLFATSFVSRSPEAWLPGAHLVVLRIGSQLVAAVLAFVPDLQRPLTAISDGFVLVSSWIVACSAIIYGIGPLSILTLLPCAVGAYEFWSYRVVPLISRTKDAAD